MPTTVELAYVLRKHVAEDMFDSDLPVQIPIEGDIQRPEEEDMDEAAARPNAILGVRVQEAAGETILRFIRRSQAGNLRFPEVSEDNARFRKLRFRIRTTQAVQGQQMNFAVTYEIDNNDCLVIPGNAPLGENWLALVTLENGDFKLLYRQERGPGQGDPCDEWQCDDTNNPVIQIKCALKGCYND